MAVKCDPDSIYIDGMEGGTGAGPHLATEETGVPGIAAIRQARKAIDDLGKRGEITLVYAGGIRNGGDVAKAIALGADAVAIGHSAMMALNCNKDIPEADLRRRSGSSRATATTATPGAARSVWRRRIRKLREAPRSRRCGRAGLQLPAHADHRVPDDGAGLRQDQRAFSLEPEDLAALTMEASAMAGVPLGRHQPHGRRRRLPPPTREIS